MSEMPVTAPMRMLPISNASIFHSPKKAFESVIHTLPNASQLMVLDNIHQLLFAICCLNISHCKIPVTAPIAVKFNHKGARGQIIPEPITEPAVSPTAVTNIHGPGESNRNLNTSHCNSPREIPTNRPNSIDANRSKTIAASTLAGPNPLIWLCRNRTKMPLETAMLSTVAPIHWTKNFHPNLGLQVSIVFLRLSSTFIL